MTDATNDDCREIIDHLASKGGRSTSHIANVRDFTINATSLSVKCMSYMYSVLMRYYIIRCFYRHGSDTYQREGSISKATSVGVNPRSYCRQPAQQRHELHRGDYSHALSTVIVKLVCSIVVIYYVFLAG